MDFVVLNKGPVVVIDDEIGKEVWIDKIIKEIESKGLPVLKYQSIEKVNNEIINICFSNFIILDWRLYPEELPEGVALGEAQMEAVDDKKIQFIKKMRSICFSPIFIFTNKPENEIQLEIEKLLIDTDLLYTDQRKNFIFIKNKQEILETLFDDISKWILENPHIYLSKIWLNQFIENNNKIFWSLYEKNSNWPTVFYHSFKEDGEDPIMGLNDLLFRLAKSRTDLRNMDSKILEGDVGEIRVDEIKSLYCQIMYLMDSIQDDIKPGDIYKDGRKYYLNIRPECDTTRRASSDDVECYLIKGTEISPKQVKELQLYHEKYGILSRPDWHVLPFLDGKHFVKFKFKDLEIIKYSQIKDKKICRLLPPFITCVQHQFSSFLGRFGTPRVPKAVYDKVFEIESGSKEVAKPGEKKKSNIINKLKRLACLLFRNFFSRHRI